MQIPKSFKIGGQQFKVTLQDLVDDGVNYGDFSYCPPEIRIATKYKDGSKLKEIPRNQIENTFLHELIHVWQYMSTSETDEVEASTFAAFWCEFNETSEV